MIMKKLFTSVALALTLMSASAEQYTCPLAVSISGSADMGVGNVTVTVDKQADGKYTMDLKNFAMGEMGVGNIHVENVEATQCGNVIALETQQTIQITAGDDANIESWMGPSLGDLPILLKGQLKNGNFNAILNIPLAGSMIVGVKLGDDANNMGQLPNSGFDEFHDATYGSATSREPNGWHSFMSATGSLIKFVSGVTHTWESDDVRKDANSDIKKCVKVASSSVLGQSANGTITTGRLNANNIFATNTSNNSTLDFSCTDLDGNGDPFYAVLNNKPDSIKVWVKFHAGTGNKHPQASLSAILSNGQTVQDPEITTYTNNIIARASKSDITSTDEWQQVSVPFTYANTKETPKGALVTISTCATPSGGSSSDKDPDILYVDDVELVYNAGFKSLTFNDETLTGFDEVGNLDIENYTKEIKPEDFSVEAEGMGAYVTKKITSDDDATYVTITVTSNDLKSFTTRTITFPGLVNAIKKQTTTVAPNGINTIYNLAGQQVSSITSGNVYIVKTTDGKTKKVIKK